MHKASETTLTASLRDILLVMFDMDGVIFIGKNFWLELHEAFGTRKQGIASAREYLTSNYDELVRIVAGSLWKGRTADIYHSMVAERRYQPEIKDLFEYLKRKHIRSAIISSGPYDLALRAKDELGIDEIRANRLAIENGRIVGTVEVMVPDADKRQVGLEVMNKLGVKPKQVMYIGDSDSDVELAKLVGVAVAYDSKSEKLKAVSDIVLEYGRLNELRKVLEEAQAFS